MSFQLGKTAALEVLAFSLLLLGGIGLGVQLPTAHADCNCFNIMVNPGFENGLNPNNPYPLGWGNWTKHGAPGSTITVDNTTAFEAFHSVKLDITLSSLDIGFIALTQDLPENTLFRNVTDRSDGIDLWFRLQPKYAGMGDVRVRILHGENVGELNYVFDADPLLFYPNSTTVDELGRPTGVKSILIPTSSLPVSGSWFHFQRNLRADWQAPLLNRTGGYMGPGFSLDITFLRVQFDALFVRNTLTGAYYAETAWADDFKLWMDIPGSTPPLDVDFIPAPASPTAGSTVVFTATASGGVGPYTYAWNFGDDSSGSGSPVSHVYSMPGNFLVTLIVTDSQLSSSTIGHAITVGPPRYSLVFNFTDQNAANADSVVRWRLFNSTDHLVAGYLLGEPTLKAGLYTIEAYYPALTGQSPEPYRIFRKQIALTSDLTLSFPVALAPQLIPGNYIAFNNSFNDATVYTNVSQQNSTYLRFEATGAPGQYTIIAKVAFKPMSVIRLGFPSVLVETWSFDQSNSAIRITTTDLGTFAVSGAQALRIPIFRFVDRSGQSLADIVPGIFNARDENIGISFQGQIPPDDFLPYYIEARFRGYTVYREMIGLTPNPSQRTIQLEIVAAGNGGGNYLAVNRSVISISLVEYSRFRISFTIEGSGQSLIIVDAPHRPLYVERNGARIASWTYDGQTDTVAIEAVAEGSFAIVLANPPDYSLYLAIGAIAATAAVTITLTYRLRMRPPSTTQLPSRESTNCRSFDRRQNLSATGSRRRFENP